MSRVGEVLAAARRTLPASEARLLLGHVLDRSAAWLVAHDDEPLAEEQLASFASLCARRRGGEPVAYLTGEREFYGHLFHVAPGVLIPRPETEMLVDIALEKVGAGGTAQILDLGTGSGCIAISISLQCPGCKVTAVDRSDLALSIAAGNATRLNAAVNLVHSDWFSALAGQRFDLIVANPPYIRSADPHLGQGDLPHEPRDALASGDDGLEAIRRITATAPRHLQPHGSLWLEHGYDQGPAVRELLLAAGFGTIEQRRDLAGIVRVSGGANPPAIQVSAIAQSPG